MTQLIVEFNFRYQTFKCKIRIMKSISKDYFHLFNMDKLRVRKSQ